MTERFQEEERTIELSFLIGQETTPVLERLFPTGDIPRRIIKTLDRWSLSPLRMALFSGDTRLPGLSNKDIEFVQAYRLSDQERFLSIKYGLVAQFKTLAELEARKPEIQRVQAEAEVGLRGYESMYHFQDESDILQAIKKGVLVPLPDLALLKPDTEFEELTEPAFRHCLPGLASALVHLDKQLKRRFGPMEEGRHVTIISAVRTVELQDLFIKPGHYAAPVSTHTIGAAVDITSQLLDSGLSDEVWQVFEEADKNRKIVFVREIEEPYKIAHLSIVPPKF